MATKNTWANRAVPERSARWLSQVEEHILRLVFLYLTLHGLDTACFSILKCHTDFTCYVTCRRFTFSATPIPPPAPRRIKWRHFHVRFFLKNYFLTLLSHDTLHFQSSSFTCTACVFIFQLFPRDLFAACALFCPPPPPPTHDSFIFFANVIFHVLTFCSRCHALNCTFGSWHVRARFLGNVRCKNRIITCEMYVTCSVEFYTGCRNPRSFIEWLNSGIHLSNPKRQWEQ